MGQVGELLRQAREAKGLTLARVEEITKIRRRYLQALEEEDFGQLPGEVFIRGFLRNYAQALELDPDEVLEAAGRKAPDPLVGSTLAADEYLDEPLAGPPAGQRIVSIALGVMAVIVVGLGAWTLYHYFGPSGDRPLPPPTVETPATAGLVETGAAPTPSPRPTGTSAPTTTSAPTATATQSPTPTLEETPEPTDVPPTPVPEMGVVLRVEAGQDVWVHVDTDSAFAYEGSMTPGQVLEWRATNTVLLSTNNAGALRVWYNGQEQPPMGGDGEGAERTWEAGPLPPEATVEPLGPPPEPGTGNP